MKPYKIVEESETHITYEYRTAYTWTLYVALLVMVAGMVIPNEPLTLVGAVAITAYFAVKLSLGSCGQRQDSEGDAVERCQNQRQQGILRQSTENSDAEVMPNKCFEPKQRAAQTWRWVA